MEYKTDCFAFKRKGRGATCGALKKIDCENCGFYKKKGTECDSCSHKGKSTCVKCREGARVY